MMAASPAYTAVEQQKEKPEKPAKGGKTKPAE